MVQVNHKIIMKLKESSTNWDKNENTYIPYIENFLTTVLNSLTAISKSEICNILPDVSPTTVEAVLGKMVKEGIIEIIGNGRNTRYRKTA